MEQNNFDIKKIKVHRTTEATVFEIVFAIVAVIVWGLIIWLVHRAPDIVPTHFDASGKPNVYGSPAGVTIPCIILTIAAIVLMVLAYFPRHINITNRGHHLPVFAFGCSLYDAGYEDSLSNTLVGSSWADLPGIHCLYYTHL